MKHNVSRRAERAGNAVTDRENILEKCCFEHFSVENLHFHGFMCSRASQAYYPGEPRVLHQMAERATQNIKNKVSTRWKRAGTAAIDRGNVFEKIDFSMFFDQKS